MPNWCNNSITIQGPTDKIRTIWHRANGSEDYSGLLNAMVEMPEELRGTTAPGDPDEVLQEKYGASNWYDWRVYNWGTKWEIDNQGLEFTDNGDGTATIEGWFDSAWAPPIEAYDAFLEHNEDCSIIADYHEGGMDFGGFYDNGVVEQCDNCYDQVRLPDDEQDDVFKRLDDVYGLTEQYEQWDADEEDTADLSPNMS